MDNITYHVMSAFPEPEYSALVGQTFSDYQESQLLTTVIEDEALVRKHAAHDETGTVRICALENERLIGWTYALAEGNHLHMISSGVAPANRRRGVYTQLMKMVLEHAKAQGFISVVSRHAPINKAVIIPKLQMGFIVSGFEYSEVFGPVVRLTYLVTDLRRKLYQERSMPIRRTSE
jgi:ribosomal protein S18 acetylase RimI-like enzyme